MRSLTLPNPSLVLLVGASGSGKSTFARKHFLPTEVVSSDACRGIVADDETDQTVTNDAFDLLHFIVRKRLERNRLVVVDATNVQDTARQPLIALAREHHAMAVAIVFLTPEDICQERNAGRPDRGFGPHVVRNQTRDLRRSLGGLHKEGFRHVHILRSVEEIDTAVPERQALWTDLRRVPGPFDIIGDVHGCLGELEELLAKLSVAVLRCYGIADPEDRNTVTPQHRKIIFLGDLTDRGPDSAGVLRLVMEMCERGDAICVPGNHDVKLLRALQGKNVKTSHGLAGTLEQLEKETKEFRERVVKFLDGLISHYVMDGGRLVVAHAGMREEMQGRASGRVREFALYGETTGETDEFGLPIRYNWAADYRGSARVVYGHTPVPEAEWLNNTINIDTGCAFGGKLTALRYPEMELVSVPARAVYADPIRPFLAAEEGLSSQHVLDDVLDLEDVSGKRIIQTRLRGTVIVREENSSAALETMSRFAAHPKWLVYLPPAMSPVETSTRPGLLEHPEEAFSYFRSQGVPKVVCQEKHMGSRAVAVVCRNPEVARARFGVDTGESGAVLTRTGRRFFEDTGLEAALLGRADAALAAAGIYERLESDWVVLDCELMPWSAKAQELLRRQYAPVGTSAIASTGAALAVARAAAPDAEGVLASLVGRLEARAGDAAAYREAYRRYCWSVDSLDDLRLAPFHLLASEGATHVEKDHAWHMGRSPRSVAQATPVLFRPVARGPAAWTDATAATRWESTPGVGARDGGEAVGVRGAWSEGWCSPPSRCAARVLRIAISTARSICGRRTWTACGDGRSEMTLPRRARSSP